MGEGEGGGTGGYCLRIGTSTLAIVVVYAPVFYSFSLFSLPLLSVTLSSFSYSSILLSKSFNELYHT